MPTANCRGKEKKGTYSKGMALNSTSALDLWV